MCLLKKRKGGKREKEKGESREGWVSEEEGWWPLRVEEGRKKGKGGLKRYLDLDDLTSSRSSSVSSSVWAWGGGGRGKRGEGRKRARPSPPLGYKVLESIRSTRRPFSPRRSFSLCFVSLKTSSIGGGKLRVHTVGRVGEKKRERDQQAFATDLFPQSSR